jgi:hypothetical protein
VSRDDDRAPDDDADTPRDQPRARSVSGEFEAIQVREISGRRAGGIFESGDSRHLRGARSRDTRRMDAIVSAKAPEDDTPPPMSLDDLPPEVKRVFEHLDGRIDRSRRSAANRDLELAAGIAKQPEPTAKKWIKVIGEKAIALILGAVLAALLNAYNTARSQLSEQHDQMLSLELRLAAAERTLAAVIVPRLSPDVLQPAARGQGAP